MRNQEKVEHEAEKKRDEVFNEIHPIPSKRWMPKQVKDIAVPMVITTALTPSEEENTSIAASSTPPPPPPSTDEIPEQAPVLEDDEELVDFENSPTREGMDMNMVYYLPSEFRAIDEEGEVA